MSSSIETNRDRLRRVYDDYRTAWMSREYNACRLDHLQRLNLWYEVVLALGASGSAISGWYVWQTRAGAVAWALIAGASALLAILKPILQIPKQVERYSKLYTGYCDLMYDYRKLVDDIKATGGITGEMRELLNKAQDRLKELDVIDDPRPKEKLLIECQQKVNKHAQKFDAWYPKPAS